MRIMRGKCRFYFAAALACAFLSAVCACDSDTKIQRSSMIKRLKWHGINDARVLDIMGSVPRENLGVAGGVIALVRNLGMVCGVAVAGAIITTVQKSHHVTGELAKMTQVAESLSFLAGLKSVFLVSAIILLCASFLSAMRVRPGDREAFERMG